MLTQREKGLIALLVAVVLAGAAYFGWRALAGYETEVAARVTARQATLRQVEALGQELQRLNSLPKSARLDQPLIGYVERLARQSGVAERIQLNLIPQEREKHLEAVEIKVDGLNLDECLEFLYAIENAQPPLVIDQMELGPSFRSRTLLRLTMRVLAQT